MDLTPPSKIARKEERHWEKCGEMEKKKRKRVRKKKRKVNRAEDKRQKRVVSSRCYPRRSHTPDVLNVSVKLGPTFFMPTLLFHWNCCGNTVRWLFIGEVSTVVYLRKLSSKEMGHFAHSRSNHLLSAWKSLSPVWSRWRHRNRGSSPYTVRAFTNTLLIKKSIKTMQLQNNG